MEVTLGDILKAKARERQEAESPRFYMPGEFQRMLEDYAQRTGQEYFTNNYQLSVGIMDHPATGRFVTMRLIRKCPCCDCLSEGIFDVFLEGNRIQQIHVAE